MSQVINLAKKIDKFSEKRGGERENAHFNQSKLFFVQITHPHRWRFPRRRSRPRIGARITGRTDRVGAHRKISDISARGIEAVKFICHAVVRRVRDQCAVKVIITIRGTVAVSRHTMPTTTHTCDSPSSRLSPHVSLLRLRYATRYTRSMLSVVGVSATRVVSNFYHDLIDRFSMSGALVFAFLFDSHDGTIVKEGERGDQSFAFLFLVSGRYIRLC